MTKYAKYYAQMWDTHALVLEKFRGAHDTYQVNQRDEKAKADFDSVGKLAREVMEEWDRRLCKQMEKGHNGVFSAKVSEKFWNEVKKDFPLVDLVGVQVRFV